MGERDRLEPVDLMRGVVGPLVVGVLGLPGALGRPGTTRVVVMTLMRTEACGCFRRGDTGLSAARRVESSMDEGGDGDRERDVGDDRRGRFAHSSTRGGECSARPSSARTGTARRAWALTSTTGPIATAAPTKAAPTTTETPSAGLGESLTAEADNNQSFEKEFAGGESVRESLGDVLWQEAFGEISGEAFLEGFGEGSADDFSPTQPLSGPCSLRRRHFLQRRVQVRFGGAGLGCDWDLWERPLRERCKERSECRRTRRGGQWHRGLPASTQTLHLGCRASRTLERAKGTVSSQEHELSPLQLVSPRAPRAPRAHPSTHSPAMVCVSPGCERGGGGGKVGGRRWRPLDRDDDQSSNISAEGALLVLLRRG